MKTFKIIYDHENGDIWVNSDESTGDNYFVDILDVVEDIQMNMPDYQNVFLDNHLSSIDLLINFYSNG